MNILYMKSKSLRRTMRNTIRNTTPIRYRHFSGEGARKRNFTLLNISVNDFLDCMQTNPLTKSVRHNLSDNKIGSIKFIDMKGYVGISKTIDNMLIAYRYYGNTIPSYLDDKYRYLISEIASIYNGSHHIKPIRKVGIRKLGTNERGRKYAR